MSRIQYVPDTKTPFIKKLYGKENNFKVETLTYFGTLYELENLQDKVETLEKALELACEYIDCDDCPLSAKNCDSWIGVADGCAKAISKNCLERAKEMMRSE